MTYTGSLHKCFGGTIINLDYVANFYVSEDWYYEYKPGGCGWDGKVLINDLSLFDDKLELADLIWMENNETDVQLVEVTIETKDDYLMLEKNVL